MPLVEIEFVGDVPGPKEGRARLLADELGRIFASSSGQTWLRIRHLPVSAYAENGVEVIPGEEPVFVKITKRTRPTPGELEVEIARLSAALAKLCMRPQERIHICYEPPAQGRQAFGGQLIR